MAVVVPDMPPSGQIEIRAEAIAGGVECPIVRGADGQIYSLTQLRAPLEAGDQITVVGEFQRLSMCMQGLTIRVERIEMIEASHSGTSILPGGAPPSSSNTAR